MSNAIHSTAIIDAKARIGRDNFIGPFCYIGPHVTIGDGNRFEAYVSVGTAAEHREYFHKEAGPVEIGNKNVFREFVTINGATQGLTRIGDFVVMLRGSHIGHDTLVGHKANLSCNVLIGGHSIVGEGANLGLGAVVHQSRVIGAYAMVGMNSTVTRHIPPFVVAFGSPCEGQKVNRIGLQRSGISDGDLSVFENWFFQTRDHLETPDSIPHLYQGYIEQYAKDCGIQLPPLKKAA
ncbi:MAG: UDP-N-acetylglucosamine acyltransferase [Pseudobdellovibrionaceae bacterium]